MPDKKRQQSEEALVNVLPRPPEEYVDNFASLAGDEGINFVSTVLLCLLFLFVLFKVATIQGKQGIWLLVFFQTGKMQGIYQKQLKISFFTRDLLLT